jgi:beta-N-acetylhexosaminidase
LDAQRSLGQLLLTGCLLTGVPGPVLDSDTAARFKKLQPGGFILFGRNIQSPEQLRKLIDDLRDLSDIEPFITIDQEGGRVSRLRLIGQEPPNAQATARQGRPALIKKHGKLTGQLLRLFGFNLDLCPVLDISYDDTADNSLKGRCWGRDPSRSSATPASSTAPCAARASSAWPSTFPATAPPSAIPTSSSRSSPKAHEDMELSELLPYTALLPELDCVMTCHSNYTAYDPGPRPLARQPQPQCLHQAAARPARF